VVEQIGDQRVLLDDLVHRLDGRLDDDVQAQRLVLLMLHRSQFEDLPARQVARRS